MRVLSLLLFAAVHADPHEDAIVALAEGRAGRAVQVLQGALPDDDDGSLRCLLGRVQQQIGRHTEAIATLEALPPDAPCALEAAWTRAAAMRAQGDAAGALEVTFALATEALGSDRDARTAARLEGMADRVLERDPPDPRQAAAALSLALGLDLDGERRMVLARRLADLARELGDAAVAQAALPVLAPVAEGTPADRRRLAFLVGGEDGLTLLEPLEGDPETLRLRLALGAGRDLGWRAEVTQALAAAAPEAASTRAVRLAVGQELAAAGWALEARALLEPVAAGPGEEAAAACQALAELAERGGEIVEHLRWLEALTLRFPRSERRAWAEDLLPSAHLAAARVAFHAGDLTEALAEDDLAVTGWPASPEAPRAAYEAGLLARGLGDPAEARRRWEEIPARWPGTWEAQAAVRAVYQVLARDGDDPDGAQAWLRERAEAGLPEALRLRTELEEPSIALDAEGGSAVRVLARGLDEVELRLHPIDLGAWLRAGFDIADLPALDVGIIAPTQTWTVRVPEPRAARAALFSTPVSLPGPGLYAVTAASPQEEARALLQRSDTVLLAQRVGPELFAAVLSHDRPVAGARVLVRAAGAVSEVVTGADGLARATPGAGELLLLAEAPSGPALLALPAVAVEEPDPTVRVAVDLDRPLYRPGDRLGFRIAVDRPADGSNSPTGRTWTLWLEGGPGFSGLVRRELEERADGTVVGELPLPLASTGHHGIAARTSTLSLKARLPDGSEQVLASVPVADALPQGRHLAVSMQGPDALITLREEDGRPAAGQALRWAWAETGLEGRVLTDDGGQARVAGPPIGVPWTLLAAVPGTSLEARAWRAPDPTSPLALDGPQDRLRPGEPLELELDGRGPATLRLVRREEAGPPLEGPPDPWELEPRWQGSPEGPRAWHSPPAPRLSPLHVTIRSEEIALDGPRRLSLPALPPGHYQAELITAGASASWSFAVDPDAPRLAALVDLGAGQPVPLRVEGAPALVTVHAGTAVAARLLRPGAPVSVPLGLTARDEVSVRVTTPGGLAWARTLPLAPPLSAELSVQDDGDDWVIRVRTLDAAGHPRPAQVALRALDQALVADAGAALGLVPGALRAAPSWGEAGGWSAFLRHGALSVPVAQALLEEAARIEEAQRARRALAGNLGDNAVAGLLGQDVPLSQGLGGLGTRGSGLGGGGSACGLGGIGTRGYGRGGTAMRARPVQGERARVLWAVVDTGVDGLAELRVPRPPRAATWRIEASAWAVGWAARALVERTTEAGSAPEPLLAEDPTVGWEPGRAAVAARVELARLPALSDADRAAALDRVGSLLGAVSGQASAYRSVGEAAQALALLGDLAELGPLPRGTAAAFDDGIPVERAAAGERALLLYARARAGLPVDDAGVARLLREADVLTDEQVATIARALILLERRPEARRLIRGEGPEALLARRALAEGRRERRRLDEEVRAALQAWPEPAVGEGARPAWAAAMLPFGSLAVPPPVVLEDALIVRAALLPEAADGLPVRAATPDPEHQDQSLWSEHPRVAVGAALRVDGDLSRAVLPAGLERVPDAMSAGFLLRARTRGTWTVTGVGLPEGTAALTVEVGEPGDLPLSQDAALVLAREAVAAGLDPAPLLARRPRLEDWLAGWRPEVADLRFRRALDMDAPVAELTAAFEDLRDISPGAALEGDALLAVARAYAAARPERALTLLHAGIGAAFQEEVDVSATMEPVLGPLAAIQVAREIAARYPAVPEVERALFDLPDRLLDLGRGGDLPPELRQLGVTPTDLRLMSAAWNREFLALTPGSERVPDAGLRLVVDLLHLGAWERAASWAERLAAAHPRHPLCDSYLLLGGLGYSGAGETRKAAALLARVTREDFVQPDGLRGPSELRADAELALARLEEADGHLEEAARAYGAAAGDLDEAEASLQLLQTRSLQTDGMLWLGPGEPATLELTLAGVDRVFARAYRLDLRTLFLRDGGLEQVQDVQVAGISPAWSGELRVRERPFPARVPLRLPLSEPGAWLVQLHAGDQAATVLILRSDLEVVASDAGGLRRLTVLRRGEPVAGVQVRALGGDRVVAAVTDARGAAVVPAFAPALVFDGPHYAFTGGGGGASTGFVEGDDLLRRVDQRLEELRRTREVPVSGGLSAAGW